MAQQEFVNSPEFAAIVKTNQKLCSTIYGVVINHEEQWSFSDRAQKVKRDLARQSREKVEQADLKQFSKLTGISEVQMKEYASTMKRQWDAAFEAYPDLPTIAPSARMSSLGNGLSPSNPIIQMIANMTGMDAETIYQAWLAHLSGEEMPKNATCETLCDFVHAAEIAITTMEHSFAIWTCGLLVFPVAILICMATAAVSFGIQVNKANKNHRNCLDGC